MSAHAIAAVLDGQIPLGRSATVQGWVRTRRDSKAGLSFVTVHDGSGFEPLQVIVPAELPNYQSEVLHLTAGCAIRVTGELVASAGKGQAVELRAETIEVVGMVDDQRFRRHRRLGRTPFRQPLMGDDHMFQSQQQIRVDIAPCRCLANDIAPLQYVANEVACYGILSSARPDLEFTQFADIVQCRSGNDHIVT